MVDFLCDHKVCWLIVNTQLCTDVISTVSHMCTCFLLEYFLNITLDRFSSWGWFMSCHHTWEDTSKYIFFNWAQNCLKRAFVSIRINDSYITHQEVDTPLARIIQSNRFANIVNLIPMLWFKW